MSQDKVPSVALHSNLSNAVKYVLALFTVAYGLGIIISNLYLSNWHVSDYTLARGDYVVKGLAFEVFVVLPVLMILTGYFAVQYAFQQLSNLIVKLLILLIAGGVIMGLQFFLCSIVLGVVFRTDITWKPEMSLTTLWDFYLNWGFWIGFIPLLIGTSNIIFVLAKGWKARQVEDDPSNQGGAVCLGVACILVALVVLPVYYSNTIYPIMEPSWGGGKGYSARINVDPMAAGTSFPVATEGVVIHETSDSYLLLAGHPEANDARQVLRIPKRIINRVTILPPSQR